MMPAETSSVDPEVVAFFRQVGLRDDGNLRARIEVALVTTSERLREKLRTRIARAHMTFGAEKAGDLPLDQALDLYLAMQMRRGD
ncbi:MAG: hypothetical protein WCS85_02220 [Candidatus Peribacteraceae bacterium]|jgi:hypothetical protein